MLKVIEGSYASEFPYEMDAMFRNRAQIFKENSGGASLSGMDANATCLMTRTRCISFRSIL